MDDGERPAPVEWDDYATWLVDAWSTCLAGATSERQVQEFLEQHPSLLPGATDSAGVLGHHPACWDAVIRQPELKGLGPGRQPDFMWVRRDTAAVRPVLIEIEDPNKHWFNPSNRNPTAETTHALDQLIEWKVWFQDSENRLIFEKRYVPQEFRHRPLEPQYVLIHGRQSEFDEITSPHESPLYMRRKRDLMRRERELFFTYDQLRPDDEARDYATLTATTTGFKLDALPPTFATGHNTADLAALIADPALALAQVPLISDARRAFLHERWKYWRQQRLAGSPAGLVVRE